MDDVIEEICYVQDSNGLFAMSRINFNKKKFSLVALKKVIQMNNLSKGKGEQEESNTVELLTFC